MNDKNSQQEALDLRAYLRPIWRRKWIVLAITIVAAAATYLISSREQKVYSTSTRLYIQDADPTLDITAPGSFGTPSEEQVANVAQLITAAPVTNAVTHTLHLSSPSVGSIVATPSVTSDFVTITATSSDPKLAAQLANTYVTAFQHYRAQAVAVEAKRDETAAQITLSTLPRSQSGANGLGERQSLLQEIETYRQAALNPSSGVQQINAAGIPGAPSSPDPKRDAIFGGVVGLVLGIIAAFCIDLLDRRLVNVSTVESIFDKPVLAVLPHVSDPTPLIEGSQPVVPPGFLEELRSLTVMLRLGGDSEPPRLIMVTSTLPQEGKSTVTRDLALVYAQSGERVLVIDGDLRRPSMARMFGIKAEGGLVQILRGEASLHDVAVIAISAQEATTTPSSNGNGATSSRATRRATHANGDAPGLPGSVTVVAHGERLENPLALMSSDRMVSLLEDASKAYDIVLLDTPPVLAVSDSIPLMEVVDSVLLVARLGQTTRQAANRFKALVKRLSISTFVGVIANDRRQRFDDEGYGSYGRYAYGHDSADKSDRDAAESGEAKAGSAAS
jgi:Mrp family chromosome partitioning ATPase